MDPNGLFSASRKQKLEVIYLISELTNQHVDMSEPETGKKQVLKVVSLKSGRFKAEILPPPKKKRAFPTHIMLKESFSFIHFYFKDAKHVTISEVFSET